jgi:hypothetical protein
MMEAVRTSETSVDNTFTRQYIPEDNSEEVKNYFGSTIGQDRLNGFATLNIKYDLAR